MLQIKAKICFMAPAVQGPLKALIPVAAVEDVVLLVADASILFSTAGTVPNLPCSTGNSFPCFISSAELAGK